MGAVPRVPYIPARYNSASELTAEVTQGGPRDLHFDLHGDQTTTEAMKPSGSAP